MNLPVNQAISRIDQVAQQNATLVEEASAAAPTARTVTLAVVGKD